MKILVCLYIQQSMTIGLFQIILPTMMVERKFSMTEISGFSLMGYLYMLKLFLGPVVDLFYIKQLGRRRSYIIPVSIILSMLLMAIGDIFSNIQKSFIIGCAIYFIISLQDLAIDAYSSQYSKDSFKFQLIGVNIGNTICLLFNMFNQYEMITLNHFVYSIAFMHAISSVYCANYLEELPYTDTEDKFRQLRIILGSVFKSPNLKELLILCFFERSGLCLLDTSFRINIVKFGAQRSHLSILDLALLPMKLSTPRLMKGYLGDLMPFSSYGKFHLLRIIENLIAVSTLYFASQKILQDFNMYFAVFITLVIWYMNFNAMMIVKNNYLASIAPKGFEATSTGLINTISYLGTKTISSVTLILLDHFDLFRLLGVGLVCHLFFTYYSYKKYQRMGDLTTNDYYNLQLKKQK